jgi:hypothetical protein
MALLRSMPAAELQTIHVARLPWLPAFIHKLVVPLLLNDQTFGGFRLGWDLLVW